jgi:hypothetical protein
MDKNSNLKIGVIGSGSWATAMIKILADNRNAKELWWWVRKEEHADFIREYKHNPNYLTAVKVKVKRKHVSSDVRLIVKNSDIIILNTPAAYLDAALSQIDPQDLAGKTVVSAIKGIVPQENLMVGDYLMQKYKVHYDHIVVFDLCVSRRGAGFFGSRFVFDSLYQDDYVPRYDGGGVWCRAEKYLRCRLWHLSWLRLRGQFSSGPCRKCDSGDGAFC